jgi:hypothetical protein
MICDDIEAARSRGNLRHCAELKVVLQHFIERCRHDPAIRSRWDAPTDAAP